MSIKASRIYGIGLAALTIGAFAACSSDETPTPGAAGTGSIAGSGTGGSGTAGSGTAGSGTAGSGTAGSGTGGSGTGGSGTGGSGTAGSGTGGTGGSGMGPFACKGTKPTSSLITSFADTAPKTGGDFTFMAGIPGGTYRYPAALVADAAAMSLNVKGMVTEYAGLGIYFNDCIDAGTPGTTGVSFKIKASLGTATMIEFRVQTNSTMPIDVLNKKGACPGTGYPDCIDNGKVGIAVTATETEVTVNWADLMGGMKGTAAAPFDAKEIVGMQWVLPWTEASTAYAADITVDEVKFVGGTFTGGGGMGGSGGTGGSGGGGTGGGGSGGGGAGGGGNGGTGGTP
jgi:uncharacterized membrane protein YgcG